MNLWVDNLREPPCGWVWARTSSGAIDALCFGMVEQLSLGHDLGGNDTTRPVIHWMRENSMWPREIHVHSTNPVGAEWLTEMIDRYRPETRPELRAMQGIHSRPRRSYRRDHDCPARAREHSQSA